MATNSLGNPGTPTAGATPRIAGGIAVGAIVVLALLNRGFRGVSVSARIGG